MTDAPKTPLKPRKDASWTDVKARLSVTRNLGYGVYDDLGDLFARYGANG